MNRHTKYKVHDTSAAYTFQSVSVNFKYKQWIIMSKHIKSADFRALLRVRYMYCSHRWRGVKTSCLRRCPTSEVANPRKILTTY